MQICYGISVSAFQHRGNSIRLLQISFDSVIFSIPSGILEGLRVLLLLLSSSSSFFVLLLLPASVLLLTTPRILVILSSFFKLVGGT